MQMSLLCMLFSMQAKLMSQFKPFYSKNPFAARQEVSSGNV